LTLVAVSLTLSLDPIERADKPPIIVELVAQTDVEGARSGSVLQVSAWGEDQPENSLA